PCSRRAEAGAWLGLDSDETFAPTQQEVHFETTDLRRRPVGEIVVEAAVVVPGSQAVCHQALEQGTALLGRERSELVLRRPHQARVHPVELGMLALPHA